MQSTLTMQVLSPNVEVFSTPPTSPSYASSTTWEHLPLISKRNGRPSTLHIDHNSTEWKPDIELETTSPLNRKTTSVNNQLAHQSHRDPEAASKPLPPLTRQPHMKSMKSPCFIHSHLDKASDWLHAKAMQGELGVAKSLQRKTDPNQIQYEVKPPSTNGHNNHAFGNTAIPESLLGGDIVDDDDFGSSLTKQLAETAVGVRELSKQLGQCLGLQFPISS
jgi:NAD+ kinase